MNKAQTIFNELGFKLIDSSERALLYKYATDYDELTVRFDIHIWKKYRFLNVSQNGRLKVLFGVSLEI